MRVSRWTTVFAACFAVTCGGLDELDIKRSSTATIPGGNILSQLVGSLGFSDLADMDLKDSQELKNQGVKPNEIDSVKLDSLTLDIVSPAGQDFGFLDDVSFFIEAPGLEKKRIAHGEAFAPGLAHVGLDVDDVELKPYVTAASMSITSEVQGHQPNQETKVKATVVLTVDIDVGGLACGG